MPSARQVAKRLRARPNGRATAAAVSRLNAAIGEIATPEGVYQLLREQCSPEELRQVTATVATLLDVVGEIERTCVPSRVLAAADVRRKSTREELASEQ
jgi:hypothetical protein